MRSTVAVDCFSIYLVIYLTIEHIRTLSEHGIDTEEFNLVCAPFVLQQGVRHRQVASQRDAFTAEFWISKSGVIDGILLHHQIYLCSYAQ